MASKNLITCFLCFLIGFLNSDLIRAEFEFANFEQPRIADARPRLSASQQAQILSDVQQHQQRFTSPSLAKYKVDRSKQHQIQHLLHQQQQLQQLIQDQQRKIAQQLDNSHFLIPKLQNSPQNSPQNSAQIYQQRENTQNLYLEKQRELIELQKQRQQLLLEQQEIKRQQEALRHQKTTPVSKVETTTISPVLVSLPAARKITPSESELFLKAIATHQKKFRSGGNGGVERSGGSKGGEERSGGSSGGEERSGGSSGVGRSGGSVGSTSRTPNWSGSGGRSSTERIKVERERSSEKPRTTNPTTQSLTTSQPSLHVNHDNLLLQLKLALSQTVDSPHRNFTTRDILPLNSPKHSPKTSPKPSLPSPASFASSSTIPPNLHQTTTTIKPPKAILDELTRGVLPPGANFEVIRQNNEGKLEEIGEAPLRSAEGKKVTFVVLEEQLDGSYKVQGVKGNAEKEEGEVESIVERIKNGEIKLPPSSRSGEKERSGGSRERSGERTGSGHTTGGASKAPEFLPTSISVPTTTDKYESSASSVSSHVLNQFSPVTTKFATLENNSFNNKYSASTRSHFIPTMAPVNEIITTTPAFVSSEPFFSFSTPKIEESSSFNSNFGGNSNFDANSNFGGNFNSNSMTSNVNSNFGGNSNFNSNSMDFKSNSNFGGNSNSMNLNSNFGSNSNLKAKETKIEENQSNLSNLGNLSNLKAIRFGDNSNLNLRASKIEENSNYSNLNLDNLNSNLNSNYNSNSMNSNPINSNLNPANLNSNSNLNPISSNSYPINSNSNLNPIISNLNPINSNSNSNTKTTTGINLNKGANNEVIFGEFGFEKTTMAPISKATSEINENLNGLLRKEGLFAMAKYLRQSGLDTVLNETGPYTIFVPTDKAFRTLLVQLGGPEKAEQKFKENPRLLSGLLLHHVIPGAFRISSLQDEMTGVSLAGTQLRVNEYAMHDHEWNDIKVLTINGAKVAPNKRNIEIPQGVAHAVDRVMFPLPVGDLVQTLQADRERRFTVFLKILAASGLQETLTGPKTFTVFAPTDAAFEAAAKDSATIWTENDAPEVAKTIISRHVIPSTLYTAGMRYYLQKDSLRPQSPVHIHKNGGRVRINEAHVVTHNVPATNGVLHAIDGVL